MRQSTGNIGHLLLLFRLRHGLNRTEMAHLLGANVSRYAMWERCEAEPRRDLGAHVLSMIRDLPAELLRSLRSAIDVSDLPRALSRTPRLNLQAVSEPAVVKRPSIRNWIGEDLAPSACGILEAMLSDRELQHAIHKHEVTCVVSTTRSVLHIGENVVIGTFRTTINYFFHDGVQFSDAISVPADSDERLGYTPIFTDELGEDLFGDHSRIATELGFCQHRPKPTS